MWKDILSPISSIRENTVSVVAGWLTTAYSDEVNKLITLCVTKLFSQHHQHS